MNVCVSGCTPPTCTVAVAVAVAVGRQTGYVACVGGSRLLRVGGQGMVVLCLSLSVKLGGLRNKRIKKGPGEPGCIGDRRIGYFRELGVCVCV